jgi:RNase P/RNase MRP subunit p29
MDDFGHEWLGKDVEIERVKGQVVEEIRGRILDISKYWLKLFVNNQVLYLNKAFILSIKPAEIGGGASGGVNGDGKQRPG